MESLMQKVDNITEELKAKDIHLEGAKVQERGAEFQDSSKKPPALQNDNHLSSNSGQLLPLRNPPPHRSPPPLRNPPPLKSPPPLTSPSPLTSPPPLPTRNKDKDVYIGDNEADKLRDARTYCKGFRKQQDEGTGDSDTECELYKRTVRKRKAWQDEEMRDSDTESESESYKKSMRKRKGKAQQVDEGIEDSDNEQDEEVLGNIDIKFDEDDKVTERETVRPLY